MKIVDNTVNAKERPIQAGDVVVGNFSGKHYLVLSGAEKALHLDTLQISNLTDIGHCRTNITKENITITFEGAK